MASRSLIFVFPGQSSRDAAMIDRLACVDARCAAEVRSTLRDKLGRHFDGEFTSNYDIQLAVFEVTQALLALVRAAGLQEQASAGLSLGEYSHLVAIGALSIGAARDLVAARGRCYDAGPAGMMAAIFPLSLDELEKLCASVREEFADKQAVAVANINSSTQNVIAGTAAAVERTLSLAEELHFVNGQIIEHHIPMHVPRFAPASATLRPALEAAPWQSPQADYWPNVDAQLIAAALPADFIDCLTRHVWQPVLWRATIEAMRAHFIDPVFVEVGPLQVLARMMSRKWIDPKRVFALDLMDTTSPAAFAERIEEIKRALAD
jgi:[acyl-carrier-protein] S-malonyltransferase